MRSRRTMLTGLAVALAITVVPVAQAAARDREGDRMPDRWERAHGLSTRTDDSARDPGRDGLSNYREYRLGTHPRKRDGIRDGNEDADHDGIRNRDDRHRAHDRGDNHGDRYHSREDDAHADA